jgi:hypothetical protein
MIRDCVTHSGNKHISDKLRSMLLDLKTNIDVLFESVEAIREQARSENFEDYEIDLLLKQFLKQFLNPRQIKWILVDQPRELIQKKISENLDSNVQNVDKNLPELAQPEVIDHDETIRLKDKKHTTQDLNLKLENDLINLDNSLTDKRHLKEKNKQLEAETRVLATNDTPKLQGNYLRTKVVVSQLFREILGLKGSKMIYANILIDVSQNKFIKLEPIDDVGSKFKT